MFTGIVRETGEIAGWRQSAEGAVLEIRCRALLRDLKVGHSISIDGVCLTVTRKDSQRGAGTFQVEVTPETLRRTNLGLRRPGDRVNLERAARISDFLGGHLVQGHVDETGTLVSVRQEGNSKAFRFRASPELLSHCALKGSIAVNGASLTISALSSESFEVTLIPHTLEVTNFGSLQVGDAVNLEADLISKYVERHVRRALGTATVLFLFFSQGLLGANLSLGPHTVLVYQNLAGKRESQFVLRLARYRPDILLEWESVSHQGTLHLYQQAVRESRKFAFTQLFEIGVDLESKDVMTVWLSQRMYEDLTDDGFAKIEFNRLPMKLKLEGEGTFTLTVDKKLRQIPVLYVRDDRNGQWTFHKDPDNPILVEYVSPYFRQYLQVISMQSKNSLRWIKKLPPVK